MRIEPHHLERVDLLARLHDADLGGERGARAPGDENRGDQHAHLAQHRYGDQIDRQVLAALRSQLGDTLIGDDDADHHCEQPDDRQRLDAGLGDLARDRRQPPCRRMHQHVDDRVRGASDEGDHVDRVAPRLVGGLAELGDEFARTATPSWASAAARGRARRSDRAAIGARTGRRSTRRPRRAAHRAATRRGCRGGRGPRDRASGIFPFPMPARDFAPPA